MDMSAGHTDKATMLAMVLTEPGPVEAAPLALTEVERPEPGPGQLRLRVSACGVCHTDLHTVEGELALPRRPIIPGHQVVGTVERRGPGALRFGLGQRLGVGWLGWSCGQCSFCRQGQENLCPQARFTGQHSDGGYAEAIVVDERFAYPLPPSFEDSAAAPLLCAGIVGYRALRLSQLRPGERLGLYGFGASAHLVIQVARAQGSSVYVFSRGPAHRQLAQRLGAVWTGRAEESPPHPLDAAIIFAPAGAIVPLALAHLRPGGSLVINAIHMSPIPELAYALLYGERRLQSVANFTRADATGFLALAGETRITTEVERWPLSQANEALRRLKAGAIQGAAVLDLSG
jgi:propanol-preferring alcohol dehydrogenase